MQKAVQSENTLFTHPLIAELRQRRKQLSEQLLVVTEEARHIRDTINPSILDMYDKHFRAAEIALQRKTLEAAEVGRREELFRIKLERGEKLTERMIEVVNTMVDREFARIHKRLREVFDMKKNEQEKSAHKRIKQAEEEGEVARMYREVVKKLHPDVASASDSSSSTVQDLGSRNQAPNADFEKFWQNAQEAYKTKNDRQMRSIYEIVCLTEEKDDFTDILSAEEYLRGEISRLARRVHSEETKLKNMKTSEPYTLRDNIKNGQWREQETNRLAENLTQKERDIARSKAFLESISAGQWSQQEKSTKAQFFNDDFMENTYFSAR